MHVMKMPSIFKKLSIVAAAMGLAWLALGAFVHTSPVVVLHYAAAAPGPVVYFYNQDDRVTKATIAPGQQVEFHTPHRPPADYYINVSLPFASQDGVDIQQPFSRVDVYIGPDTRIARTVVKTNFMARFGRE
jgi:hypothetical protein